MYEGADLNTLTDIEEADSLRSVDLMISRILTEIPYVRLNGDKVKRLPNNVNVSIQFIEGESLLLMLDNFGICASSGSACTKERILTPLRI